jgi:hypothetical protein
MSERESSVSAMFQLASGLITMPREQSHHL